MTATRIRTSTRLRVIQSISACDKRNCGWRGLNLPTSGVPRSKTAPKDVERGLNASMQSRVSLNRPHQQRSKDGLAKNMRDLRGRQVSADFAALLPQANNLRMQRVHALL